MLLICDLYYIFIFCFEREAPFSLKYVISEFMKTVNQEKYINITSPLQPSI